MKVLILKPSSLGDVVHALPVLRVLKQAHPGARVHWWIEEHLAPLLEGDSELEAIHLFKRRDWRTPGGVLRGLETAWRLRRERFDWVVDLQGLARSAWFGWLTRGAMTAGVDSGREGARGLYDVAVRRPSENTHAVDWNLAVLKAMRVEARGDFEWIQKRTGETVVPESDGRWVVFCPGARWPNKRWPVEHFAKLGADLLAGDDSLQVAVLGDGEDAEAGEIIAKSARGRCKNLAGKTTIPEMVDWLRCAQVVVANDSGPLHVAVALERPVVALYGPTHAGRTGPYHREEDVMRAELPCAPCMMAGCAHEVERECLRVITPAAVAAQVRLRM